MSIDNLLRDIQESLPADPYDGRSIIIRYEYLASMIRDYDSDIKKQLEAKDKGIEALKDGIARLASSEAFHMSTARVSTELVLRMEYAENLLKGVE